MLLFPLSHSPCPTQSGLLCGVWLCGHKGDVPPSETFCGHGTCEQTQMHINLYPNGLCIHHLNYLLLLLLLLLILLLFATNTWATISPNHLPISVHARRFNEKYISFVKIKLRMLSIWSWGNHAVHIHWHLAFQFITDRYWMSSQNQAE